jgi:hypothetical protein
VASPVDLLQQCGFLDSHELRLRWRELWWGTFRVTAVLGSLIVVTGLHRAR